MFPIAVVPPWTVNGLLELKNIRWWPSLTRNWTCSHQRTLNVNFCLLSGINYKKLWWPVHRLGLLRRIAWPNLNICSSNDINHLVCFGLYFKHSVLSQTLGIITCTFATGRCFLRKDTRWITWKRIWWNFRSNFLYKVDAHIFSSFCCCNFRSAYVYGCYGVFSTYFKIALGIIPEQILQGKRVCV